MKIRFRLKGFQVEVKELHNGISVTIQNIIYSPEDCAMVSPLLEQRINACKTLQELLHLLFNTTEKTEAVMALFDKKMEALEKEGHTLSHHPLNHKSNGSTSSAQFA